MNSIVCFYRLLLFVITGHMLQTDFVLQYSFLIWRVFEFYFRVFLIFLLSSSSVAHSVVLFRQRTLK